MQTRNNSFAALVAAFIVSFVVSGAPSAQTLVAGVNLPPPDSAGWIKIFRGVQDTGNFYRFMGTTRVVPALNRQHFLGTNPASPSAPFTVLGGDTIRSAGSPAGHLIFKQPLSHHRVRFQMRWPGSVGNTGILMKVQENDTAQSQGFPRSVECQGDPMQGIGQIWALGSIRDPNGTIRNGGTWVTFRGYTMTHPSSWATTSFCSGNNGGQTPLAARYDSTAPEIHYGGGGDPCNNLIVGGPGWQQPRPAAIHTGTAWRTNTDWVTVEVDTRGHDTTIHYVEGQMVMKYHSPRIAPRADQAAVIKYLTSGLMAWQSEGSNVYFRNLEIKLYPEDPLYPTLYPTSLRGPHGGTGASRKAVQGVRVVFEGGFPVFVEPSGARRALTGRRVAPEL
jgi:hypothetical protein